jgi:hypothetical protein
MLLRRVIEHVKAQQWTAVALDFVLVVAGVFVGLQVQERNSARGHRAAEIGHRQAMGENVAYSIGSLERTIELMQRQQAARIALHEFSTNPAATLLIDEWQAAPGIQTT